MPAPRPVDRPGDLPAPDRPVTSRALTRFDAVTTRAWVAIVAAVWVVVVWVLVVGTGFDSDVQMAFATVCSGITVTTQHRAEQATQLKLDELIRSLPQADDRVVRVEASSDAEIGELEQRVAEHHRAQRVDDGSVTP